MLSKNGYAYNNIKNKRLSGVQLIDVCIIPGHARGVQCLDSVLFPVHDFPPAGGPG